MEVVLRCIQCNACLCFDWRKNYLYARWTQSPIRKLITNSENCKTCRNTWSRSFMRSALVRSWKRYWRMERKRKRSQLYFWCECCFQFLERSRYWFSLQSASSCWIRIWVFREETISYNFQCAKLLWLVRQLRSYYERGWIVNVFLSNLKIK